MGQAAQPARHAHIKGLKPDALAVGRARILEALAKLGKGGFRRCHALAGLLQIAFTSAATVESRLDVVHDATMR
jgi:hypothetical protein